MWHELEDSLGILLHDILTQSQHFRLTIDLKKLRLAAPLCDRVVDDQAFVDSVSLSYLTSPVFQSNDVFHAVSVRRNSRDPTELVVTDGYCSFRFEDRLTWMEFVSLFLPSDHSPSDPVGAALPIYVRAQLEDDKCSTVGIGTLSFASFLNRRLPSLKEMPSSYFAACTSLEKGVDIPVFEILMKLPLITKETSTITGILCVGVAIDVMNLDMTQNMRQDPRQDSALANIMSAPITNVEPLAEYSTAHYGGAHDADLSRCVTSDNYSFVKHQSYATKNAEKDSQRQPFGSYTRVRPDSNQETRLHGREKRAKSQERARPRTQNLPRPRSRTRDRSQERFQDGIRDNHHNDDNWAQAENRAERSMAERSMAEGRDMVKEGRDMVKEGIVVEERVNAQDELAMSRVTSDQRKAPNNERKEPADELVGGRRHEPCQAMRGIADSESSAANGKVLAGQESVSNVGGTSPQESGIIQGNKDHLLQCEVMLLKLNAEQAHQKFREEMKLIETKSEERLETIRKENQCAFTPYLSHLTFAQEVAE